MDTAAADAAGIPAPIPPAPVPTQFGCQPVMLGGGPCVAIQFRTPQGTSVFFFDRDTALAVAADIKKAATSGPRLITPAPIPGMN